MGFVARSLYLSWSYLGTWKSQTNLQTHKSFFTSDTEASDFKAEQELKAIAQSLIIEHFS